MLLKALEEPPGDTVFVLLADEMNNDLVTIASRCVTVPFPPGAAGRAAALARGLRGRTGVGGGGDRQQRGQPGAGSGDGRGSRRGGPGGAVVVGA